MLEYINLNKQELEELDPHKTIFLMALSPIEAHGPHLPLGTDVIVAEELQKRYAQELKKEYPNYTLIRIPSTYMGSDTVPAFGSLSFPAPALKKVLLSLGKSLANKGFRYLFLSDNHGGPRHHLAIEIASRKLWKKHGFYLINPFSLVFKKMVQHDKYFMDKTGLKAGKTGDDEDAHAGTNETSLMLAIAPDKVSDDYREVPPSTPPPPSRPILLLSRFLGLFSTQTSKDLKHLANVVGWINDPNMKSYMGTPAFATEEAGEAMLKARVDIAMQLFRDAIAGKEVSIDPMLWRMKFLHMLPE